jgi:ABC-type uncharacterized transport system permease subunit
VLTVGLALSQHVAGLGITLLATSAGYYAYRVSFPKVDTPPTITPFAHGAGCPPVLAAQTPLTLLALLLVPLIALGAVPHAAGPGLRMVGENPAGGRRPGPVGGIATRTGAIVAGSALMGVAGASSRCRPSTRSSSTWSTAAAGSAWRWWCLPAGGPARRCWARCCSPSSTRCSCACSRPAAALALPYQVYLMLPYVLSIVALVLVARARLPAGADEALPQGRALTTTR